MTRALRSVSSEKGRDPREFALIAYGGAGPVHAAGLAEELGCTTVLVPALAGLFSSLGLLFARPEFHDVHACHLDARAVAPAELDAHVRRAPPGSRRPSRRRGRVGAERRAALRRPVAGRSRSSFPVGARRDPRALIAAFEDEHERLYGVRGEPGSPIEIRALRLAGLGPSVAGERLRSTTFALGRRHAQGAFDGVLVDTRARARRSASSPSRARFSSTSTTPRSSCAPAGPSAATRRPRR